MIDVGGVTLVLVVGSIAAIVGIALGIFFLAPRIDRLANRPDEDPGDRDD